MVTLDEKRYSLEIVFLLSPVHITFDPKIDRVHLRAMESLYVCYGDSRWKDVLAQKLFSYMNV